MFGIKLKDVGRLAVGLGCTAALITVIVHNTLPEGLSIINGTRGYAGGFASLSGAVIDYIVVVGLGVGLVYTLITSKIEDHVESQLVKKAKTLCRETCKELVEASIIELNERNAYPRIDLRIITGKLAELRARYPDKAFYKTLEATLTPQLKSLVPKYNDKLRSQAKSGNSRASVVLDLINACTETFATQNIEQLQDPAFLALAMDSPQKIFTEHIRIIAGKIIHARAGKQDEHWIKVDSLIKKILPALLKIITLENKMHFVLNLKALQPHFDFNKEHPLLSNRLEVVSVSESESTLIVGRLVDNFLNNKQETASRILLDELMKTEDAKEQLKIRAGIEEQKKQAELKEQCEMVYGKFIPISERFRKLVGSDLEILIQEMAEKDVRILELLELNRRTLEEIASSTISTKKNAQKKAQGDLRGNEQRAKEAQQFYDTFFEICDGKKMPSDQKSSEGLRGAREQFRRHFDVAVLEMPKAFQAFDLKKMLSLMKALTDCEQECEERIKQLTQALEGMNTIIRALGEQNERIGAEKRFTEDSQRQALEEKERQEKLAQQELILKRLKLDVAKQQESEAREKYARERVIQRAKWLAKGAEIQQEKKLQLERYRQIQRAKEVKDEAERLSFGNQEPKYKPRPAMKSSSLVIQLEPKLKKIEVTQSIRRYLQSFMVLISDQITYSEENRELEGYALLGKLAQLLEAMKQEEGEIGELAREVRNSLYHGDPKISSFATNKAIEGLIDMILRLLLIDWNNKETVKQAVLPEYFVKLALYPRKEIQDKTMDAFSVTVSALFKQIQKLDGDKPKGDKGNEENHYKIPRASIQQCEKRYNFYKSKRAAILARSDGKNKAVLDAAVGYLEGVMGSYAKVAQSSRQYNGFLKTDPECADIIERGRAFRHNRVQLKLDFDVPEEMDENFPEDMHLYKSADGGESRNKTFLQSYAVSFSKGSSKEDSEEKQLENASASKDNLNSAASFSVATFKHLSTATATMEAAPTLKFSAAAGKVDIFGTNAETVMAKATTGNFEGRPIGHKKPVGQRIHQ